MTTSRRELVALSSALFAGLAGCLADGDGDTNGDPGTGTDPDPPDRRADADDLRTLVRGNTAFAFDLLESLAAAEPGENRFVSPFSVSVALAMTWAGARSDTEEAMAEALRFELDQDDLHPAFEALGRELDGRSELDDGDGTGPEEEGDPLELTVANALWGREDYPFREEFLEVVGDHYDARLREMDFQEAPEESREEINAWVAERTEDRIEDLLPEGAITPSTVLVLTNAIYFLAGWHHAFDEGNTADAEFTALDGSTGEVAMMHQTESFPYAEGDDYRAIELPYVGRETSMVVILPDEGEFEAVEADLDADSLVGVFDGLENTEGTIELPRFGIESSVGLSEVLRDLGMEVAFTGDADFGGMVEGGGIWIDEVYHDTFVAVDEEGTEAAAATAVEMVDSAPVEEFEMTVDRPFLFLIRDRPTDAVLFLGRVVDVPDDPDR